MELNTKNVNTGLVDMLWRMRLSGERQPSRNGNVLRYPEPVTIIYQNPIERVLVSPERDANPFFHFMECLWMMQGRDDVEWIARFNKRMIGYSDDLITFNGAYGHRWRHAFGEDQLLLLVDTLTEDNNTRRAVLTMWSAPDDLLNFESKDLPCNTHIYFDIVRGRLNMTVCNRSNDIIWGMFGANAVHMSFLQEIIASMVGVGIGLYRQFSNNAHLYMDSDQAMELLRHVPTEAIDPYHQRGWEPYPIALHPRSWLDELNEFMDENFSRDWKNPFFPEVAIPIWNSWFNRKNGISDGIAELAECQAEDWRYACEEWIVRRMDV